jgi:gliding motility-associated-like protein
MTISLIGPYYFMKRNFYLLSFLFIVFFFSFEEVRGQCPQFFNTQGTATTNPTWINCMSGSPANVNLTIQLAANQITTGTINWGDGTGNFPIAGLVVGGTLSHTYPAVVDTYLITITKTAPGTACSIQGHFINEYEVLAGIILDMGGTTNFCAPQSITFKNTSTNVSKTTSFTVDFGDGSPILNLPWNASTTINHTYLQNTVNCNAAVTITARNACSGSIPSSATISPVRIFDRDTAAIGLNPAALCLPNNQVTVSNTSVYNCVNDGNIQPRLERWIFHNYFGLDGNPGTPPGDSIINWRTGRGNFTFTLPSQVLAGQSFCITLFDSSYCGVVQTQRCIVVNNPPVADIDANPKIICQGESVAFTNTTTPATGLTYLWNFGAGSGIGNSTNRNPGSRTFNNAGTFLVTMTATATPAAPGCTDFDTVTVVVLPRPAANFTLNGSNAAPPNFAVSACDSVLVNFAETSTNENKWEWDFENDGIYDTVINTVGVNPAPRMFYALAGGTNTIVVKLRVTRINGCMDSITRQIRVYKSPIPAFVVTSVCVGKPATFNSGTTQFFPAGVSGKTYSWSFPGGVPNASSAANPNNIVYAVAGTYTVTLTVSATGLTGTGGCPQTFTDTIRVEPPPVTGFTMNGSTANNISGCSPFTVNLGNTSTGAFSNFWKLNVGNAADTTSVLSPTHTYINNTGANVIVSVRLITRTQFGCSDSLTKTITIFPNPVAAFTSSPNTIFCNQPALNFTNTSTGAITAIWDYGDGSPKDTVGAGVVRSHLYVNPTALLRIDTVTMIAINANGCRDTATMPINVYPNPSFDITETSDTGCTPFTASFTANNGAALYNWDFGNGQFSTSQNPLPVTFVNNSGSDTTYKVRLTTITAFGCLKTIEQNIVVQPNPVTRFIITPANDGCTPFTFYFIANNSVGVDSFAWNFDDGTPVFGTAADTTSHQYINNTTSPIVRTITLRGFNAQGCFMDTTKQVTIYPPYQAQFSIDTISCTPFRDTVVNQSMGGTNYRWYVDGILQSALNNIPEPVFNLINNSTVPDTVNITLTVQSPYSAACALSSSTRQVVVLPKPDINIDPDTTSGCHPLTINFLNQTIGATTYSWDFGDGNTSSSSATSVQHTFTNVSAAPITRTVNLSVNNSHNCPVDTSINITIYPRVESRFRIDTIACTPFRDTVINESTGAANYRWYFDGVLQTTLNNIANPDIRLVNNSMIPDTIEIRLESESPFNNACRNSFVKNIIILPTPRILIDPDTTNGCHPLIVHFLNQSVVPAGSIFNWNFDNGNLSNSSAIVVTDTFENTGIVPRIYTVNLQVTSPSNPLCIMDTSIVLTVYPRMEPDFTLDTLMCSPFIDTAINTTVGGIKYFWKLDNGTEKTTQDFPLNVTTPGIHTVTLRAESPFGCTKTISKTFRVLPLPQVAFIPDTTRFCHPATIDFLNQTTGAVSHTWNFGDGTILNSNDPVVSHTFSNTTSDSIIFPVRLTSRSADNCVNSSVVNVTIFPQVIADFTIEDTLCSPYIATTNNLSVGATRYEWSVNSIYLGDQFNKQYTLINNSASPRRDTINLRAYNRWGCDAEITKIVTVLPKPHSAFIMSAGNTCQPRAVDFTNLSTQDAGMTYTWYLGTDTLTTTDPAMITRVYDNPTTQTITHHITLICTNQYGCTSQFDTSIKVSPFVDAIFTMPEKGCSPFTFKPDNQSVNARNYDWSWSDDNGPNTSPLSEPDITLVNNSKSVIKTFSIKLTVTSIDLCTADTTINIDVYPTPDAAFDVAPQTTTIYPNTTFTFKPDDDTQLGTYSWDFGDGNTATGPTPPPHIYTTWGSYPVKLVIANAECTDSSVTIVKVRPPRPIPEFYGQAEGCPPQVVQFRNASQYGRAYRWSFGDNTFSEEENPMHVYNLPGVYNVELKVFGFEEGTVEQTIKLDSVVVHQVPDAYFKSQPKTVYLPSDPLVCYNLSTDAISYEWDFGDGTNSVLHSPQHYYTKPGEYTIVLIATNEFDCRDTFSVENAVIAEAEGNVLVPNAFTPNANGPGGGFFNPQDFNNDVFYPLIKGAQEYYLSIYNRWGELLFESRDLHIGWDGYYRGKLCKQDVYVWKIEAKFSDGRRINKAGDLLLLR